ncbi:uncharacterized protein LOC142228831 [Haematobia irritans]|uniref:uncharacterized protein LOC142228831 n=1 Tax=Haematobia irritans TaxID=7368 RepID=UPI003F4FF76B
MINNNGHCSNDGLYNMVRILSKHKTGLSIVHINAQSLNNKMDEFREIFQSSNIDIICVSETWFHVNISNDIYELEGYKLFRADRESNAGGVCMYLRNEMRGNLKLKSECSSPIEYLFLEVYPENGDKILIGTVYRPNRNIPTSYILDTLELLTMYYNDVIICGDFNSNLLVDKILSTSMNTFGLYSINTTIPTHYTHTGNTLIDAIFVNCLNKILLYDQLSAPTFSKHDLLFMTYDAKFRQKRIEYELRDFRRLNYNLLNKMVNNIAWDNIYYFDDVEDQVNFMQQNISTLFNASVPLKIIKSKPKQQPWFNQEIKTSISKRDLIYKRWKRYKTVELHEEFKNARREVNEKIKVAKTEFYRQQFGMAVDSGSKWKVIRDIGIGRKHSAPADIDVDNLNEIFARQSISTNASNDLAYPIITSNYDDSNIEFNFNCVEQCESWKFTKIIPLPKPKSNEFRPIAILPYLSKVLERIMCNQMNTYIKSHNLITEKQSGFRPQRSCITVFTDVIEYLRSKLDENMVSVLVLLDHSKALLSSYLSGRTQSVYHCNKQSSALNINKGVPQGSLVGPLLFCLYVNDLPAVLRYCKVHLYADDVQVYASTFVNKLPVCIEEINKDLERINNWALTNELMINPTKSKCLFIYKKNVKINKQLPIYINNEVINTVQSATNLGVTFNEHLTLTNHIQSNIAKTYGMLRNLWTVQSSTPHHIRMLLSKTYLIPVLLYGVEIFGNCSSADKQKLRVAYNNIARYVFNKKRYNRISTFAYQLFNMTFDSFLNFKCLTSIFSIKSREEDHSTSL